jgi:multiple sugar transport system permease protein
MTSYKIWNGLNAGLIYLFLFVVAAVMLIPFYWTVITALKIPAETITFPIVWIPSEITFEHLQKAWQANFLIYYRNSTVVALAVLLGNIFTSAMAGFIFAKFDFPLKNFLFLLILSTTMIPFAVVLIPLYLIITVWMHLKDSLWAMILPALISPFGIFMMRQFIQTIPDDLLDAARIDGSSDWGIFWRIIMPLSKPALAALAIFHFIWIWNDFLWPLIVTDSDRSRTLPIGVVLFAFQRWQQYNVVIAGSLLIVIPLIVVYFIFQRAFVQGIVLTGMKY